MTAPDAYLTDLARGTTGERVASLTDAARRVHRAVLRTFADTGEPPTRRTLDRAAGDAGAAEVALRQVPLPGHLRHLQLAKPGGSVLVPNEDADALLTVALPAGTVLDRIPVGDYPHDATATQDGPTIHGEGQQT